MTESEPLLQTGSKNGYEWLVSTHTLSDVFRTCPDVVLGKYVAITSFDSGPLRLNDEQKAAGWEIDGGIAYSPKIQHVDMLPLVYFEELYVFASPIHLGVLIEHNIFKYPIQNGQLHVFVNYDFGFHDPDYADLARLFWQQLGWIEPESYLAENDYLNFVSTNRNIFASVHHALRDLRSRNNF